MNIPHNQNWLNKIRHQFLLAYFDGVNEYQEKEVNGFILIKQFNAKLMDWEVAIYTKEAFAKRKSHKQRITGLLVPRRNKQKRG